MRLHFLTFMYLHNVLSLLLAFVVNFTNRGMCVKTAKLKITCYLDIPKFKVK